MTERREALIAAREQRKMSRAELADALGVNRSHVHHVETGVRNPSWDLMMRWTTALKATGSKIWAADRERFAPANQASFERAHRVWDLP